MSVGRKAGVALLLGMMIPAVLIADSQRDELNGLFVFEAGEPVRVDEVNENFQVLGDHAASVESLITIDGESEYVGVGQVAVEDPEDPFPGDSLHVITDEQPARIKIESTHETGSAGLKLKTDSYSWALRTSGSGKDVGLVFQDNDKGESRLFIGADGLVGLGTVHPEAKLDVSGDRDAVLRLSSSHRDESFDQPLGAIEFYGSDESGPGPGVRSSIRVMTEGSGNESYMVFSTADADSNDVERMRIDNNGHVGIGTLDPTDKVSVVGGNIFLARSDSGVNEGMIRFQGNTAKPQCTAETQGSITYEESGGANNGHFYGCRGIGGGQYEWAQLDL